MSPAVFTAGDFCYGRSNFNAARGYFYVADVTDVADAADTIDVV
jgi:hypothetical protein